MELILKYFPDLTEEQKKQFAALYDLYTDWNSKINVISRKDIENLYEHHVLHSLGIAQIIRFKPGTKIMDLGTGGGFPGIPLAILFPEVQFHLVDSIGKKVRVATEIANSIGLKNVTTRHARAEEEKQLFDFVVSRAVMPLADLLKIIRKNISPKQQNVFPNGLICLKGGELEKEAMPFKNKTTMWNLKEPMKPSTTESPSGRYTSLSSSSPSRKYSCCKPSNANTLDVNTMNGSFVKPKIAGMESKANITSVVPMVRKTISIGVQYLAPFLTVRNFSPSYSSVILITLRNARIKPFS